MYSPSPSLFTRCVLFSGFYFHSYNFSFCIHFSLVYHDCVCFLVKYCYLNEYEEKRNTHCEQLGVRERKYIRAGAHLLLCVLFLSYLCEIVLLGILYVHFMFTHNLFDWFNIFSSLWYRMESHSCSCMSRSCCFRSESSAFVLHKSNETFDSVWLFFRSDSLLNSTSQRHVNARTTASVNRVMDFVETPTFAIPAVYLYSAKKMYIYTFSMILLFFFLMRLCSHLIFFYVFLFRVHLSLNIVCACWQRHLVTIVTIWIKSMTVFFISFSCDLSL